MPLTPEDSVIASNSAQLSTDLGGEFIILSLVDEVYYGLDGVGARIWELIQEPRTVAFLSQTICDEYDVEADRCANDIETLLTDLSERGLIEISPAAKP